MHLHPPQPTQHALGLASDSSATSAAEGESDDASGRNGPRVYGIDQDKQQEYASRFCQYLGGSKVRIASLHDVEKFSFDDYVNPDILIWDLHESDERDRGAIFATLKAKLVAHMLEHPAARSSSLTKQSR